MGGNTMCEKVGSKETMRDLGEFDIAIIGLGVAGSNLASLLQSHLKVIAIDKKDSSGDCFDESFHKPCGGLLSEGGQKAFATQGLNLPTHLLVEPQIFAINTIDYGYPYASYIQKGYINMERHAFDLWQKSRIPSHISTFHKAYFKSLKQGENGIYTLHFKQQDSKNAKISQDFTCKAKIIIGADGAKSHLRRYLYPQLKTKSLVCIQEWYKEHNAPMLSCIFDKELTPSYSWSMSKNGYFIFGGAYPHANCQERFATQIERLHTLGFIFGKPLKKEACLVLQPTRLKDFVLGHSGVFLVGEAAGFINASTLEGISGAMNSSRILAHILNACDINALHTSTLHKAYRAKARMLIVKTLFRHYVRYPFMFIPCIRRLILRFGLLRLRKGLENGKII
ncbi:oxidoreductase [Helicobacter cinaedi]|uniref:FAD-binding protein n=1 Tax=Helicobacter cinaedi TaxID=213 RepID=UPI001F223698|nr:FAD-binding protein [Helicobacter cinaedi]BDB66782.1 oxidoreductase [Helicobacter cinaedi]